MDVPIRRILTAGLLVLLFAPVAAAQANAPGNPWTDWRGCWRLVSEAGAIGNTAAQPMVCVTETQSGARLTTTIPGQPAVDQLIQTDGRDQRLDEAGCQGTQRAQWSPLGARLYSTATLVCASDREPRRISGYGLFLADGTWLDIQAVDVNRTETVRVRRYRRADSATSRVPAAGGRALSVDDVKEASGRVSLAALEAAIVESAARIPLSSRTLLDLDAAGVPDMAIDLLVAVSYPDRFVVEHSARTDRGMMPPQYLDDPFLYGAYGLPMWSARWGYYGSYWDPYYYSPFGYTYFGRYNDPYYAGVPVVIGGGGGGTPAPQPSGRARVVDGRGYTQTRPRETAGEAAPSGSAASSAPAASSSSGTSSVSSSGFSSGGGSGDTGRTAVPR